MYMIILGNAVNYELGMTMYIRYNYTHPWLQSLSLLKTPKPLSVDPRVNLDLGELLDSVNHDHMLFHGAQAHSGTAAHFPRKCFDFRSGSLRRLFCYCIIFAFSVFILNSWSKILYPINAYFWRKLRKPDVPSIMKDLRLSQKRSILRYILLHSFKINMIIIKLTVIWTVRKVFMLNHIKI